MKRKINRLLDWFERHFNYLIELIAFVGGVFCLFLAVFLFIVLLFDVTIVTESNIEMIFIPGIIGFFGVIILFALRITRHLTND